MPIVNRIVTRGLGTSRGTVGLAGLITIGMGGPPSFVVEALTGTIEPRLRYGGSSGRRRREDLELVIIWAKLVSVNDELPKTSIEGRTTVQIDKTGVQVIAERVASRIRKTWSDIKVTVKRIK